MTAHGNKWPVAAALSGGLLFFVCVAPATAQQSFCSVLKRVMDDTPNKYMSFKGARYHDDLKQWDANISLPGMQGCRIDVEIDNYQCYNERLSHRTADQQERDLVSKIQGCLPGVTSTNRSEEKEGIVRSVIEWKTSDKRQVQIVKRHSNSADNVDKIFLYVEEAD